MVGTPCMAKFMQGKDAPAELARYRGKWYRATITAVPGDRAEGVSVRYDADQINEANVRLAHLKLAKCVSRSPF